MPLQLGTAWYPEHWPEERWPEDAKLMRECGLTVVRVAEFAWADMEPREGAFNLGWLQRAIGVAADHGLKVVLGTPSAAPPAWLTSAYPDTLAVGDDGRRSMHGARCHYDVTSERYMHFCRRIAEKMAVLFGHDSRVIGWQIDNEFGTVSYSESAHAAFQAWLHRHYGTLDRLNDAWATSYWSQKYTSWTQIPMPTQPAHSQWAVHNPALLFKWKQFITNAYRRFQQNQIDVIRANAMPEQWVMHDHIGYIDAYDSYLLDEDLDLVGWNQYFPNGSLDFARDNFGHDQVRGQKRKNFWLTETQPGSVNWAPVNVVPDRGHTRAAAWTAVAHGADAVLYWQWRNALGGQEQYHGSILASDGQPRPIFDEIRCIGEDFHKVDSLLDAPITTDAAMLFSYDDQWAIKFQRHHAEFDYTQHLRSYYRALTHEHIALDVVSTRADLAPSSEGYKLIVAAPHVMDASIAESLTQFVESGGHLVLGARTGTKTHDDALWPQRQPALLQELAGVHVEEYYALPEPVALSFTGESRSKRNGHAARIWAEWLAPHKGTQVLARYGKCNGWLDGQAAITVREHKGGGRVYTVGAWLDEAAMAAFMRRVLDDAGVQPVLPKLPEGVHAMKRGDAYIVVNSAQPATVSLPRRMKNVLTGKAAKTLALAPWDVAVLM